MRKHGRIPLLVLLLLVLPAPASRLHAQVVWDGIDTHDWIAGTTGSPITVEFVDFQSRRCLRGTVTSATAAQATIRTRRFLAEDWRTPVVSLRADVYVTGAVSGVGLRLEVRDFSDFNTIVASLPSQTLLNDQWQTVTWTLPGGAALGRVGHLSLVLEGIALQSPVVFVDDLRLVTVAAVERDWDRMEQGRSWYYAANWRDWSGIVPTGGFPGIEPVSSLDGSPGSSAASVYLEWDFNNGQGAGQGLAAVLTTGSGDGLNADFSAAARIGAWVRASTAQTAVRMWIYDAETDTGFFTPCQFLTGVDTWEEVSWLIPWPPEFDRTDVDGVAIVVDGIDAPGVQTGSARFDQITLYASTTPEPPSAVGRWLPPQPWPVTAIHSALLPTGKVLQYSYPTSDPGSRAMLFDPDTGLFDNVTMNTNIFCSGQSLLADGRLFVTGGNDVGCAESPRGIKDTHIFDPVSMTWTKLGDMSVGRWYPTNVLLGDGRLLLLSGIDHNCESTPVVERFTPGGGIEVMAGAARFLPLYPLMHLLTSGKVAQVGPNPDAYTFDPMAGTWEFVAVSSTGWRGSGTSVLVPGETDAVMIIGGAQNGAVTASCERIDFSDPVPQWRPTGSLTTARAHANAVILPDRTVLVVGGGEEGLYCSPISVPELYDPATETWTPLPPQVYGRMYHSTAVLLPDGRVLSAGQDADASGSWGEIYEPAYLFRGPRPVITTAPVQITYGDAFTVATPAAANITSVALIRPSAVTHSVNMDQRYVGLSFSLGNAGELLVTAPPDGNRAPPGYYMLFLVDAQGVPSVAKMVRLATSCPVSFSPRLPLGAVPATRYLSFEGANAGQQTAVRVTLGALPAPYDAFSGRTMWVGQPQPFCENGGINAPPVGGCGPGQSPSWGSTLQCTPFFTDWSTFGTVYVFHANLVPNGRYDLQAVNELCGTGDESLFSRPLGLINSRWGDLVGAFDSASNSWTAPDGLVEVVSDVIAIIDKFAGRATAPIKARTDLEPATPDRLINISDATVALDAFRGRPYPFAPGPLPCP